MRWDVVNTVNEIRPQAPPVNACDAQRRPRSRADHKRDPVDRSPEGARPTAIPLGRRLPDGSSDLYPGAWDGQSAPLFGLAAVGVYLAPAVTGRPGELLPHRFTLTLAANDQGGLFSVALSPPHDGPPLTANLPYAVPTFLDRNDPKTATTATVRSTRDSSLRNLD